MIQLLFQVPTMTHNSNRSGKKHSAVLHCVPNLRVPKPESYLFSTRPLPTPPDRTDRRPTSAGEESNLIGVRFEFDIGSSNDGRTQARRGSRRREDWEAAWTERSELRSCDGVP